MAAEPVYRPGGGASSEDVAKLAGVSRATVSRVLNGTAKVSPEVRRRVDEAVAALGYEPDLAARSLVSQRSRTIVLGFFSADDWGLAGVGQLSWHFYLGVLREIDAHARAAGYDLLLPSHPVQRGGTGFVRSLNARRVAGAVVACCPPSDPRVHALVEAEIPTVFIDVPAAGPKAAYVTSDNRGGALRITQHLIELGHREIAVLTGPAAELAASERIAGTRAAMARAGILEQPELVVETDWTTEAAYDATLKLLDEGPPFTAVVAHSDILALGALSALRERGARVPDDVSVTGFDCVDLSAYANPPLTTVRQDPRAISSWTVETLAAMIDGGGPPADAGFVPTELVVRQSTAPAPGHHRRRPPS